MLPFGYAVLKEMCYVSANQKEESSMADFPPTKN